MNKEKQTCLNEVRAHQPRHLLLKGIRFFNRGAVVLIGVWMVVLGVQQVRLWALHSPVFELKQIVVRGNTILDEECVLDLAHIETGSNLFLIEADVVQPRLLAHDYIRAARIRRRWPSTLRIEIEERKPVAVLTEVRKCVDDRGVLLPLLSSDQETGLPVLTGIDDLPTENGDVLRSEKANLALALLKGCARISPAGCLHIRSLDMRDTDTPLLFLHGTGAPVRLGGVECLSRLPSLVLVLSDLERKGITAEYIDVRFLNQIVVKPTLSRPKGNSTVSRTDPNTEKRGSATAASPTDDPGNASLCMINTSIENGAGITASAKVDAQ